jgi:predicted PurR-regulated permease PerM
MPNTSFDRATIFRFFFIAALLFLLYQLIRVLSPFFDPLVLSVALAMIFYPFHLRLLRWCGNRPNLAAAVSVTTLLLLVIVPAGLFLWLIIRESVTLLPAIQARVTEMKADPSGALRLSLPGPVAAFIQKLNHLLDYWKVNPQEILMNNLNQIGARASALGATLVRNTVFLLFNLFILSFSLFFLFRDGPRFIHRLVNLIPMEHVHKELILRRLDETLSAVVRGMVITAMVQGLLAGIGYAVVGLNLAVVLAAATTFTAMIPIVGATATWLPVTLYVASTGALGKALFLLIWGVLAVSGVDNLIRPILIGERAKIPIFLLFFGTLGGLQVYGLIGLLLGPLMIAGVLSFLQIYSEIIQSPTPSPAGETGVSPTVP